MRRERRERERGTPPRRVDEGERGMSKGRNELYCVKEVRENELDE